MITIKIHGVIQHREYELQASSIEEIKQQVVLLWQTKPLTRHLKGAIFAFLCFAR